MTHSFYHQGTRSRDRHAAPAGTQSPFTPVRPPVREWLAPMLFLAVIVAIICVICAMMLHHAGEWPLQE